MLKCVGCIFSFITNITQAFGIREKDIFYVEVCLKVFAHNRRAIRCRMATSLYPGLENFLLPPVRTVLQVLFHGPPNILFCISDLEMLQHCFFNSVKERPYYCAIISKMALLNKTLPVRKEYLYT